MTFDDWQPGPINRLMTALLPTPQSRLSNPRAPLPLPQPDAQPESYRNVPGSLFVRLPDPQPAAQGAKSPDPWAGLRQATVDPMSTGSVSQPSSAQYADKRSTRDKLFDMFSGWASGNDIGQSLALGAQGYRGGNKTVQMLMNNGYSQEDAEAINGNRDALNMALGNIMRKQDPQYALKTQATQLGIEKTQAQIDALKNGQRGLINAGGGNIYNPNNGEWISAPNAGKNLLSVDGSNLDLDSMPTVAVGADGKADPDQQKAFFSKLPAPTASLVQGIIDGRVDLTKSTSMKDGQRQAYARLASMGDPNFDMSMGPLRVQTRKNYGPGGYMGKMSDSTNLAIQHLYAMKQAYDQLNNGNFNTLNAIGNWWHGEGGNGPIAAFKAAQNGVAGELEKTFTGSNGTEGGRADWKNSFNENASPDQMKSAIETAMHMLSSRVETYNSGWDSAMGSKNQFPMLKPNTIKALKGMGFDTSVLGLPSTLSASGVSQPPANNDSSVSINGYKIRKL